MSDFTNAADPRHNAMVQALTATIMGRKLGIPPARLALERYGDTPAARALVATIGSQGGFLIPSELSSEVFIDALRPLSIVRRHVPAANFLAMENGNLTIGRADSAPFSSWISEDSPQQMVAPTTVGAVTMLARKSWVAWPVSNDLFRRGAPDLESVIRSQLLKNLAATEDAAFINGNGGLQPKGLLSAGTTNASSGTTNAEIIADLQGLFATLEGASVKMTAPTFMTTPAIREHLMTLTAAGSGNWQFPSLSHNGTILGIPMEISTNVPAHTVILVDAAELLIGTAFVEINLLTSATYTDTSGNRVSAFDKDETLIRLISGTDIALMHTAAAAVLNSISYA
jgi:HK97 family phage major capsid protein